MKRAIYPTSGGRRIMPSALPAELAEAQSDDAHCAQVIQSHEEETEKRARISISEDIVFRDGWHRRTFYDAMDVAFNNGCLEELSAKLKAVRVSFGQPRLEAVYDLCDYLDELVDEFISPEMVRREMVEMEE